MKKKQILVEVFLLVILILAIQFGKAKPGDNTSEVILMFFAIYGFLYSICQKVLSASDNKIIFGIGKMFISIFFVILLKILIDYWPNFPNDDTIIFFSIVGLIVYSIALLFYFVGYFISSLFIK